MSGHVEKAKVVYERGLEIRKALSASRSSQSAAWGQMSDVLRTLGRLYEAEVGARKGLQHGYDIDDLLWQSDSAKWLGVVLMTCGQTDRASHALHLALAVGHWGLQAARNQLSKLQAPTPEMPAFDPSEYEVIPSVEIPSTSS